MRPILSLEIDLARSSVAPTATPAPPVRPATFAKIDEEWSRGTLAQAHKLLSFSVPQRRFTPLFKAATDFESVAGGFETLVSTAIIAGQRYAFASSTFPSKLRNPSS